jgi:uncharacterized protein YbaA (DUF1428 family)
MSYVDGFVIPVAEGKIEDYRKIAENAGKIWLDHGALDYKECVLEHGDIEGVRSFKAAADAKQGETVVFAFIVYESRAHRDAVNEKVMADPRLNCDPHNMPFDCARMAYAGFKTLVEYAANTRKAA